MSIKELIALVVQFAHPATVVGVLLLILFRRYIHFTLIFDGREEPPAAEQPRHGAG